MDFEREHMEQLSTVIMTISDTVEAVKSAVLTLQQAMVNVSNVLHTMSQHIEVIDEDMELGEDEQ